MSALVDKLRAMSADMDQNNKDKTPKNENLSGLDRVRTLGEPAMYVDYNMSPDGKHLLVETMKRPFSRLVLMNR